MDPDVTLRDLLEALRKQERIDALHALKALHGWIFRGGFLPHPDGTRRDMDVSPLTVMWCREYVTLRCSANRAMLELTDPDAARTRMAFEAMASQLLRRAPSVALPALDSCKRVLEIDTHVVDPNVVLMRASVQHEQDVAAMLARRASTPWVITP